MTTKLEYDKKKLARLKKSADDARHAIKFAKPAYRAAGVFLDQWVQKNFRTEGGNIGGWPQFALGGRKKRGLFDATAKLLQDTGALRISFKPFASNKNAGIGSDLDYSEYHNEGIGVPQRRMLPKQSEVNGPLRDILEGYVDSDIIKPIQGSFR